MHAVAVINKNIKDVRKITSVTYASSSGFTFSAARTDSCLHKPAAECVLVLARLDVAPRDCAHHMFPRHISNLRHGKRRQARSAESAMCDIRRHMHVLGMQQSLWRRDNYFLPTFMYATPCWLTLPPLLLRQTLQTRARPQIKRASPATCYCVDMLL